MIIRPELRALRGDDTPQRQAQRAIGAVYETWRRAGLAAGLDTEMAAFAEGAVLEDLPMLAALFAPEGDSARRLVMDLVERLLAQLAGDPLGQAPLRYSADDAIASLVLARHDTATLLLQSVEGSGLARRPAPVSVSFAAVETYERVLAGTGLARRVTITGQRSAAAQLRGQDTTLAPGPVHHRIGLDQTQFLLSVPGSLVTLKLQRRTASAIATREYRLSDGALVHQSAGTPRESRLELAAALLGRMGRSDAAPLLAAMAEEEAGEGLRWQALRECLALDTAHGFALLCRIAARADDPLAAPAGALRAQLLETYPQLAGVQPCPM
ncbi:MAG TPA: hypothetical protein PKN09_10295 [Novosphingobium sp.]|nr:hypothetical protein [Novosphingobium sp.]